MRDYKPQFKKAGRQAYRKTVLFLFLAISATIIFLILPQSENQPVIDTQLQADNQEQENNNTVISTLALPDKPQAVSQTPVPERKITIKPVEINQPGIHTSTITNTNNALTNELPPVKPDNTGQSPIKPEAIAGMSPTWESRAIKNGDSLANIFKEWKLSPATLHKIVNSSKLAATLANIHPGQTLKLLRDDDDGFLEMQVVRSPTESLYISKTNDGFETEKIIREVDIKTAFTQGTILSSLFVDGQSAGLTDAQIMELAGIFGWDIDFALEIRKGDSFKVLYEEHFLDGKKLRNGPILAAEFENNKKTYKAVRYTTPKGLTSYYDPDDGRNKKRAFIRTPVKFARISSRFSGRRYHPVLKKWRSHRGVDYAAPTGTPVKATGNGKVIFRGRKGGYGNTVILQHGSKYKTLYAHLSKYSRASKKGRTVKQGQVIGYVGKTGLATGPHLHYEFRVHDVHRNPLTVKLPKADPINKKLRNDFNAKTKALQALFEKHAQTKALAQTSNENADG